MQHYLSEKQHKLKKLLGIPEGEKKPDNARELEDQVTLYFRQTASKFKVDHIIKVNRSIGTEVVVHVELT